LGLPTGFRGIAPDLRGYGGADRAAKIDARRGMGDWVDDVRALLDQLGIERVHAVGHSLGGGLVFALMMDASDRLLSATLVNPASPYGFGGTKDVHGTPCYPDFAGSGGGIVNPEFPQRMAAGDRSAENPVSAPRVVMNTFYWKPPFRPAREEDLLSALLSQHVGPDAYPGDMTPSENWPGVAPGAYGPINAASPKYAGDISRLYRAPHKVPVLWVCGSHDQIVSDNSLFDLGTLGAMGAVPNYPGPEIFPPQPMVSQTHYVLEQYAAHGGTFREVVIEETGHTPYIEKPSEFNAVFHAHISA
jgi:pimeloyl-ACP methyl ester carboxylesterase